MLYGYARVSTYGQAKSGNSLTDQKQKLYEAGCQEITVEQYTGTTNDRPIFSQLLKRLKPKDTLVVTKLDRIARNASEGINLINELLKKGINVHILNMGFLDNSPTGKLIATIMLAFAQFERDMIVERTQAGKAVAKQSPNFVEGRPRISKRQTDHALELLQSGMSYKRASELTGISVSTLARRAREKREAAFVTELAGTLDLSSLEITEGERKTIRRHKKKYLPLLNAKPVEAWRDDRHTLCIRWDNDESYHYNEESFW